MADADGCGLRVSLLLMLGVCWLQGKGSARELPCEGAEYGFAGLPPQGVLREGGILSGRRRRLCGYVCLCPSMLLRGARLGSYWQGKASQYLIPPPVEGSHGFTQDMGDHITVACTSELHDITRDTLYITLHS